MTKIRWGIVGPGIIAQEFAYDIKFVENAQLTAVASRSAERAEKFAKQYDIPLKFNSYQELYNCSEVDAVYVATPHNFHFKNSLDAMKAGKAVLCEKPLTPSFGESENLFSHAEDFGVYLAEGLWTRYLPAIKWAIECYQSGHIGKLIQVKADFGYPKKYDAENRLFNPALAGGVMLDMGCYTTAITNMFIKETASNSTVICRKAENNVDTSVDALLQYDNGKNAMISASFEAKLHNWAFIIGSDAYIAIPDFWRASQAFLYNENGLIDKFEEKRIGFGFSHEIEYISNDLLKGLKKPSLYTHEDSLKNAELLEAIISKF